jgi:hypothetical protein
MSGRERPVVILQEPVGAELIREDGKRVLAANEKAKRSRPKVYYTEINKLSAVLVVPTGLFHVKTGIYMPNNFKGLDGRPLGWLTKKGENFAMYLGWYDIKLGESNRANNSI